MTTPPDDAPLYDFGTRVAPVYAGMTFEPGDVIGDAVFEGYFETHSAPWHHQRTTGYGGSTVAAVCGFSKWESAYAVWAERTGKVAREEDNKNTAAKLLGSLLEPVILGIYARRYPGLILVTAPEGRDMSWRSRTNGLQLMNPDALAFDPKAVEWGIVESKTARFDDEWKDEDRRYFVPEYYRTQVIWYHSGFGFTTPPVVCVLFTGQDYVEIVVEHGPLEAKINLDTVIEFDRLVRERIEPEIDGSEKTWRAVRREHPEIERDAAVDVGELFQPWADAKQGLTDAEAEELRTKTLIVKAMGKARIATRNGETVARRQNNAGGVPHLVMVAKK
jgi:predicted phage-related endonuclease